MSPAKPSPQDPVDNADALPPFGTPSGVRPRRFDVVDLLGAATASIRVRKNGWGSKDAWWASCPHDGCSWETTDGCWQEVWLSARHHQEDDHSPTSLWMTDDRL